MSELDEDIDAVAVIDAEEISEDDIEKLKEMMAEMDDAKQQQLEQFSGAIAKYRDEAITGREASGIETIWDEDEDAYTGVDDANRDEEATYERKDKNTLENSYNSRLRTKQVKSTVFLNITRPYTDAAAARVGDMLLPTDDKGWAFKTTPIPEAVDQALNGAMGEDIKQQIQQVKDQMDSKLKEAETQVEDWMIETDYTHEVRKAIEDCTRVGTGVMKGPYPEKRKTRGGVEIKPASKHVNYDNLFPDPSCGDDIQNGKYVFERDGLTVKRVRELIEAPGYLESEIDKVLSEGPNKRLVEDTEMPLQDSEVFEVWYFHGLISKNDLEICGCEVDEEEEYIPAMATVINDHVIHVNQYPVDTEDYPYDVITWQRRKDHWAGIGIARQIRTPQRMLVAANRNMMDNAGISGGPQIIRLKDIIKPVDGNYELTPNKQWTAEDDVDIASVANAFIAINIPSVQEPLNEIIQFALKMAEDVTGMPMIMQGGQGQAPDTVGGMTLLNNNANTVLRRIARTFDTNITIPHVKRYYMWAIEHEGMEGDYEIEARGSSTLVERDIQNQAILQMGQMVLNPAFGVSPELWMQEYLRSLKFDPKKFQDDSEDKADPEKEQMMQAIQGMEQELQSRQGEKQAELEYKHAALGQERELAMMKLAIDEGLKLEELRTKLGLEQIKAQKDDSRTQQDVQFKAIDGKIKVHEAQTRRMSEQNKVNELNYKAATGNQGI